MENFQNSKTLEENNERAQVDEAREEVGGRGAVDPGTSRHAAPSART